MWVGASSLRLSVMRTATSSGSFSHPSCTRDESVDSPQGTCALQREGSTAAPNNPLPVPSARAPRAGRLAACPPGKSAQGKLGRWAGGPPGQGGRRAAEESLEFAGQQTSDVREVLPGQGPTLAVLRWLALREACAWRGPSPGSGLRMHGSLRWADYNPAVFSPLPFCMTMIAPMGAAHPLPLRMESHASHPSPARPDDAQP